MREGWGLSPHTRDCAAEGGGLGGGAGEGRNQTHHDHPHPKSAGASEPVRAQNQTPDHCLAAKKEHWAELQIRSGCW